MKLGTYNITIPIHDEKTLVYNTLAQAAVFFDSSAERLLSHCTEFAGDAGRFLRDNLMLVESSEAEQEIVKFHYGQRSFGSTTLNLVAYLTYNCNFDCSYCYEKQYEVLNTKDMSEETARQLVEWTKAYCSTAGIRKIELILFGGEPLLKPDLLTFLTTELKEYTRSRNMDLGISLVTNGSLLTADMLTLLKGVNFRQIQVTIDGAKATHDTARPFIDGRGSYDTILSNLAYLPESTLLLVRANLQKGMETNLNQLIDDLSSLSRGGKKIYLDIAATLTTDWDRSCATASFLSHELGQVRQQAYVYAVSQGLRMRNPMGAGHCFARNSSSFAIEPDGTIYNCTFFAGKRDFAIGHVQSDVFKQQYFSFMATTPYDEECLECAYFPICIGGCRAASAITEKTIHKKYCRKEDYQELANLLPLYFSQEP